MTEIEALLAKADRYCKTAHLLAKEGDGESSVSRSYYAMFYAAQAILLTKDVAASSHGGVIAKFSELFVKTGILPREMSTMIAQAQAWRLRFAADDFIGKCLCPLAKKYRFCCQSTCLSERTRSHQ